MRYRINIAFAALLIMSPMAGSAQQQLTITDISPASGPTAGGTVVTITGTGFSEQCPILCTAHTVLFGGVAATNVKILNATTITATTPPHSEGTVDVERQQTIGFDTRLASGFTYVASEPLTLQGGRFRIYVSAVNRRDGRTSAGVPIPYNDKFGFFSFPQLTNDPTNPEAFVKIVGPLPDGAYILLYEGLTDFEYTLTVNDLVVGTNRSYVKPAGTYRGDLLK